MSDRIRIFKHERRDMMDRETALETAKAVSEGCSGPGATSRRGNTRCGSAGRNFCHRSPRDEIRRRTPVRRSGNGRAGRLEPLRRTAAYRLLAAFLILKSSIRLPESNFATSQRGCLPRPAQVSEG